MHNLCSSKFLPTCNSDQDLNKELQYLHEQGNITNIICRYIMPIIMLCRSFAVLHRLLAY